MSNRLRRKSRPQADVQLYGGPLKQTSFKGGINIDRPASEIGEDQLAGAENVICFPGHVESRPGTKKITESGSSMPGSGVIHNFMANKASLENASQARQYLLHRGTDLRYLSNPPSFATYTDVLEINYDGATGSSFGVNGDSTIRPFARGNVVFTGSKICYLPPYEGYFQINAPNPVHGLPDSGAAAAYERRYLVTLSRITDGSGTAVANRLTAGAALEHESGSNGNRYYSAGAVSRDVDYATAYKASAFGPGAAHQWTSAQLRSTLSSLGVANDNAAAKHFTHVTIWATLDIGSNGRDGNGTANSRNTYVWLGDVSRATLITSGLNFDDDLTDEELRRRMDAGLMLASRGFEPLPSGAAGEATNAWLFCANRAATNGKGVVYYSQVDFSPEHMGYYYPGNQFKQFGDAVTSIHATKDILTVFCANSSHTTVLTAFEQTNTIQANFILTHWTTVDETLGVKDWGSVSQVDKGTLIAVCSDASVRMWDTSKWGPDLSYDCVNSEIAKIVPANPLNFTTGSFGIVYRGAYYLFYSKSTADSALTRCLRYGFGERGGHGWTFYTNWATLPFRCGATLVIDDANRVQRLVAVNVTAQTGGMAANDLYWLETFDAFSGATERGGAMSRVHVDGFSESGAGSNTGASIACSITMREYVSGEESEELIHQETHAYFRPYLESVGFISGLQVSMSGYVNGSPTAANTISNIPKTGDWHFTQELSGRRIQIKISTNAAQFRIVAVDSHCRSLDRINFATAGDNVSSESTTGHFHWQKELAGNLLHWITRATPLLDRAKGVAWTASGTVSQSTGPDGESSSAHSFNLSTATSANSTILSGDFTVVFSVKSPGSSYFISALPGVGAQELAIRFNGGNLEIAYMGGGGATLTIAVTLTVGGWDTFVIVRSGTAVVIYQNGVQIGTATTALSFGGGALTIGFASATGQLFDVRIYTDNLSTEAIAYYWDELDDNNGAAILPTV